MWRVCFVLASLLTLPSPLCVELISEWRDKEGEGGNSTSVAPFSAASGVCQFDKGSGSPFGDDAIWLAFII